MQAQVVVDELTKSIHTLSDQILVDFIKKINSHDRIFVYGTGRSGLMLKAFAMRLMQIGLSSFVVGETTTPSVQKGDLLIIASASGETDSVNMMATSALKQGTELAIVLANQDSTLGRIYTPDIIVSSGTKFTQSKESIQPLGSLFEQMLLIIFDTIILMMSADKNEDMANRHASLE